MPTRTTKRKHRNDTRRTTAPERARAFSKHWFGFWVESEFKKATKELAKVLERHAAAALARRRAKGKKS